LPGKKHGYAILKDVEEISDGRIILSTGTLYGALGRLLEQGLIVRVPNEENQTSGPGLPRKAYLLTEYGRHLMETESDRLQSLVAVAKSRLSENTA
jgi:DNA-binding PadR family transcriptional regulator